jgi:hypothetical protein
MIMGDKKVVVLIDLRRFPKFSELKQHFKIESIKNSADYVAGGFLNETQTKDLCKMKNWEVKIRMPKNSDL